MSTVLSLLFVPTLMIATGIIGYFALGWLEPSAARKKTGTSGDLHRHHSA